MNIIKEVLKREVYPAMGCTELASVAICAAHASKLLKDEIIEARIKLDSGTYKNGLAVTLPNTCGEKGNFLAAALGIVLKKPELKMGILKKLNSKDIDKAKTLIFQKKVKILLNSKAKGIRIEAVLKTKKHTAICRIIKSHTEISFVKKDGKILLNKHENKKNERPKYKEALNKCKLADLFLELNKLDKSDLKYIRKGITLNLNASKLGLKVKKVGYYLNMLIKKGFLKKDILSEAKLKASAATDARMAGIPVPIMSSGESGNQGVVAILVPHIVGKAFKIKKDKILKSIALSHLINAYIKTFTGELSPICGCAVAAGVGASVAVTYQLKGPDIKAATLAINNVISDIGGMLCDGAKSGCALKVASSADSAIRSAYMAANYEGITELEGFIGKTAEETIKNIAQISKMGMSKVDKVILKIMADKNIQFEQNKFCDNKHRAISHKAPKFIRTASSE